MFNTIKNIIENASKSDFITIVTKNSIESIKNIDLKMTFNPSDNSMTIEDCFKTPSTTYLFNIDEIIEVKKRPSKSKRIPSRTLSVKSQSIDPIVKVGEI